MAFKLPSVFFVKTNEETNENLLFVACRRNELEKNLNGSITYKLLGVWMYKCSSINVLTYK